VIAKVLGFDLSTTGLAVGVQGVKGEEDFASVDMLGAMKWYDQPAFNLEFVPVMIESVLKQLISKGWDFSKPGALSFSVRQHDMVVLDRLGHCLAPALSWQCNAAIEETIRINKQKRLCHVVGRVEERFILPKMMWLLKKDREIRGNIGKVMTTGDYIAGVLTGIWQLSSSDAYCNGLLNKGNKELAAKSIEMCGLSSAWFPSVIGSGKKIGKAVKVNREDNALRPWSNVCSMLEGWEVISSLGDNHAGAVGCGLCSDETIVVSAGTSGTVVRIGHKNEGRAGIAACFEYYDEELLLMMMARCADWYKDFVKDYCEGMDYEKIDAVIIRHIQSGAALSIERIRQIKKEEKIIEVYPKDWEDFFLVQKAICVQASIALELLLLVKKMLLEVTESDIEIKKVVVTGGLSRSSFFQMVLKTGLEILQDLKLYVGDHQGPLAYKAAALGALINAKFGVEGGNISEVIKKNCPVSEVPGYGLLPNEISTFLQEHLF
jgi:sugar (pentulose or hexulose) kinase